MKENTKLFFVKLGGVLVDARLWAAITTLFLILGPLSGLTEDQREAIEKWLGKDGTGAVVAMEALVQLIGVIVMGASVIFGWSLRERSGLQKSVKTTLNSENFEEQVLKSLEKILGVSTEK